MGGRGGGYFFRSRLGLSLEGGNAASVGKVPVGLEILGLFLSQHRESQVRIVSVQQLGKENIAFICKAEAIIFPYAAKVEVERVLEVGHSLADAGEQDLPALFRVDAAHLLDLVLRNGGDAAADELELVAVGAFFNRCAHQDDLVRLDDLFQGGSLPGISRLHFL